MSTSVPAQQIPIPLYCKSTIIQLKNRYLKINGSWGDQLLFCRVSRIMFALNFFHLCNYIWEPNRSLKIPKTPENQDFPGCLLESSGGGNWCTADLYRKLRLPSQSPLGTGISWKGIIKFSRPWKFSPWCIQTQWTGWCTIIGVCWVVWRETHPLYCWPTAWSGPQKSKNMRMKYEQDVSGASGGIAQCLIVPWMACICSWCTLPQTAPPQLRILQRWIGDW